MLNLNRSNLTTYLVIAVWFISVVVGLVYFQVAQLSDFDRNKLLNEPNWFNNFKQQVKYEESKSASLVIVTDPNCGCTIQAKPHLKQLTEFSKQKGVSLILLEQSPSLKTVIPSTPAAVVLNKEGEFVYAGPLSEGLGCAQGSGFVETVITNLMAGFNNQLLLNNTKGCYCTTQT
ncbi:hypothetical protein J8L73_08445 [Pseudoalteromonas sp. MMG006]|uniref:DUF6436 domain-containing protein n=1 Tax=unclassified Pseudoalteromonas TaxID=194690 RepID=UPI001B37903C|nr:MULTISPECIES: DUF6436 domain-containing protein [unclassified Pseudoalteromonas]MBQ4799159.1 hypothetical protein [Pseudoalteromonas sp. MMG006]MBQ4857721.1 hypothetical protein [Pseudoalteromonas sp. MMG007]